MLVLRALLKREEIGREEAKFVAHRKLRPRARGGTPTFSAKGLCWGLFASKMIRGFLERFHMFEQKRVNPPREMIADEVQYFDFLQ